MYHKHAMNMLIVDFMLLCKKVRNILKAVE